MNNRIKNNRTILSLDNSSIVKFSKRSTPTIVEVLRSTRVLVLVLEVLIHQNNRININSWRAHVRPLVWLAGLI
jgi:hypothetical protein